MVRKNSSALAETGSIKAYRIAAKQVQHRENIARQQSSAHRQRSSLSGNS
jgi:hypothetical protein